MYNKNCSNFEIIRLLIEMIPNIMKIIMKSIKLQAEILVISVVPPPCWLDCYNVDYAVASVILWKDPAAADVRCLA